MLIDTHCHLDDSRYFDTIDETIYRAKQSGVEKFILPAAGKDDLQRAIYICDNFDDCYFSVGSHPYHHCEYDEEIFNRHIIHNKCVAVGECGLDYYRLPDIEDEKIKEKKSQANIFISHINLAKKYMKPLIVHIRDANEDSKKLLIEHNAREVGGVLHCFNADSNLLELAEHGFYFGIGGVLTFTNARKLVEVLPKIPKNRLLFETDAPYLSPVPYRGKTNEPAFMVEVVKKASAILDISYDDLCAISSDNAQRLFGL